MMTPTTLSLLLSKSASDLPRKIDLSRDWETDVCMVWLQAKLRLTVLAAFQK